MKSKILSSFFLVGALAISSCSDKNDLNPGQTNDSDKPDYGTVFTNVRITMPGDATRAEEFEPGTDTENAVSNFVILFYDELYKLISYIEVSEEDLKQESVTGDAQIEKKVWNQAQVVPVTLFRPGQPVYAVALLNVDLSELTNPEIGIAVNNADMKEVLDYAPKVYKDDELGFLITSSGYYDGEGQYNYATLIRDYIFTDKEEAEKSQAINIYVERAAAKVNLEIAGDAIEEYDVVDKDGNDLTVLFKPISWGLTATETSNYLVKNSSDKSAYSINANYHSNFANWIDYSRYRTFWAESPIYNDNNAKFQEIGGSIEDGVTLKYIKYGELEKLNPEEDGSYSSSQYTFEHTFPVSQLTAEGVNKYAVPTSVVLYGGYTVTGAADKKYDYGFFLRNLVVSNGNNDAVRQTRIYTVDELKDELAKLQNVVYEKSSTTNADGEAEDAYNKLDADDYTLVNVKVVSNGSKSSNAYTIQLEEAGTNLYYMVAGEPTLITTDNLDQANAALAKNVGNATYYGGQKGFFYLPVPHFNATNYEGGFYYDDNGLATNSGDFGVVRNHVYKINIKELSGLAFGSAGKGDPNDPPTDPDDPENDPDPEDTPLPDPEDELNYYFNANIEVLQWHVISATGLVIE